MFDLIRRSHLSNDQFRLPVFVNRLLDGNVAQDVGTWIPPVDILESDTEYRLQIEAPGLSRDSINVSLENNVLTVAAEKRPSWELKEGQYFRGERRFGKFSRSYTVPNRVNSASIQAHYKDGVLELVLPKTAEAQPHRIQVTGE